MWPDSPLQQDQLLVLRAITLPSHPRKHLRDVFLLGEGQQPCRKDEACSLGAWRNGRVAGYLDKSPLSPFLPPH